MNRKTKKLVTVGMLCALAYLTAVAGRVPMILFLKYDPKDVVIAVGGLIYGPVVSFMIAVTVSVVEMVTVSSTGIWGCLMNIISSCSFACTASFVYARKRKLSGAMLGLLCGVCSMSVVMLLWNYLVAPIYMGIPRGEMTALLFSAFLPFNLLKGGLNAAVTILVYKPVITALRRSRLIEFGETSGKMRFHVWAVLTALLIIIACVLVIIYKNVLFNG